MTASFAYSSAIWAGLSRVVLLVVSPGVAHVPVPHQEAQLGLEGQEDFTHVPGT